MYLEMKRIAIIEDDSTMREALAALLRQSSYEVQVLDNYEASMLLRDAPALLLLDLNLPAENGLEILKNLRKTSDLPVIMLTSSGFEADEALSMGYGADDYITKPYSPNILLLRIAAILRRTESTSRPTQYRNLKIDLDRGAIESLPDAAGRRNRLLLTKNEMIILRHLLEHNGTIVTRDALMADLWNNQEYINDNALTVNISRLRTKLAKLGAADAIETRKNLGYILS